MSIFQQQFILPFIVFICYLINITDCQVQSEPIYQTIEISSENLLASTADVRSKRSLIDEQQLQSLDHSQSRITQQAPSKIKIVYDYSLIDNDTTLDEGEKDVIKEVCENAKLFISSLVKVYSRKNPISIQPTKELCYDIPYSNLVISPHSVSNADMFIMVTSYYNDTTTQVANAIICQFDTIPMIGRISINVAMVNENAMSQLGYLYQSIVTHELIHVLGFSKSQIALWQDPQTNQPFGFWFIVKALKSESINGQNYNLLTTKNVQNIFQRHYSCDALSGMPLELVISSHFARLAIYNEVMNPFVFNYQSDLTQFTSALLKDTGYYQEVNENLIQFSGWGLNQGCQFIKNTCLDPFLEFDEFNYASNNRTYDCDVNGHGKSYRPLNQINIEQCESFSNEDTQYCTELNVIPTHHTGESFNQQSKCIRSSYMKNTIWNPYFSVYGNTRCFTTLCQDDGTLLIKTITGLEFLCEYPNQLIQIENDKDQGYIYCPSRFQSYCFYKQFCPNNCSYKGFCYNGVCSCIPGQGGEDCSIKMKSNNLIFQGNFVNSCPSGYYSNPNRVCMSSCPLGFFQDVSQQCVECYGRCSKCTGPAFNQCTKCNLEYILINNMCIESNRCSGTQSGCRICFQNQCYQCKVGYYLNEELQLCQPCSQSCHSCFGSPDFCTSCKNFQFLTNHQCIEKSSSIVGCQIIDLNNPNVCSVCKDSYVLDQKGNCQICPSKQYYSLSKGVCQICSAACKECQFLEDHCLSCENGYVLNENDNECIPFPTDAKYAQFFLPLPMIFTKQVYQCHRTCLACYNEEYTSCLECQGNRILVKTAKQYYYICVSPAQATDYIEEQCSYDYFADQVIFAVLTIHSIAIIQQVLRILFKNRNFFRLVILFQTYQTTSYLRFINVYFPLEIDNILRSLQIYNIFNYQVIFHDSEIDKGTFINPKFLLEEKSPYFFANTVIILVILFAINFSQAMYRCSMMRKYIPYKALLEFIIFINFFAIQELLLNLFQCISFFNYDSSAQAQLLIGFFITLIFAAHTFKISMILSQLQDSSVIIMNKDFIKDEQGGTIVNKNFQSYDLNLNTEEQNSPGEFDSPIKKKLDESRFSSSPSKDTDESKLQKMSTEESRVGTDNTPSRKSEKLDLRKLVIKKQLQTLGKQFLADKSEDNSPALNMTPSPNHSPGILNPKHKNLKLKKLIKPIGVSSLNVSDPSLNSTQKSPRDTHSDSDSKSVQTSVFKKESDSYDEDSMLFFNEVMFKIIIAGGIEKFVFVFVVSFFYFSSLAQFITLIAVQVFKLIVLCKMNSSFKNFSQYNTFKVLEHIATVFIQLILLFTISFLDHHRKANVIISYFFIISTAVQPLYSILRRIVIIIKKTIIRSRYYCKRRKQIEPIIVINQEQIAIDNIQFSSTSVNQDKNI